MTVVGVLSDTHGHLYPRVRQLLEGVDHIIHAGDVGSPQVLAELRTIAPSRLCAATVTLEPGLRVYPSAPRWSWKASASWWATSPAVLGMRRRAAAPGRRGPLRGPKRSLRGGDQRAQSSGLHREARRRAAPEPRLGRAAPLRAAADGGPAGDRRSARVGGRGTVRRWTRSERDHPGGRERELRSGARPEPAIAGESRRPRAARLAGSSAAYRLRATWPVSSPSR